MLLTADAEAGEVPIDPGPVDVLKVAHHGSEDAGLGALLDRVCAPAGGDLGRRGQPLRPSAPGTLAELAAHGVQTPAHGQTWHDSAGCRIRNSFVVGAGG